MINFANKKITKIYLGRVALSGTSNAVATYYIDSNDTRQLEIPSGVDVLSRVTPTKSGYIFVGWREDTTASSSVLNSKTMGSSDISLYAVFSKTVTLTAYNGSTTASTVKGNKYYNNGNVVNPKLTLAQASLSGWSTRGWSTSTGGNATVNYSSISNTEFADNITLYGLYNQTITLTTVANGTSSNSTGTRYYNSVGNYVNPTFTVSNPSKSGTTFQGWSSSSSSTSITNSSISGLSLAASTTRYAVFKYANATLKSSSTNYEHEYGVDSNTSFTVLSGIDGTKYASLSVTAQVWEMVCAAWSMSCNAYANLKTMNGSTAVSTTCLRYMTTYNAVYEEEWETTSQNDHSGYPCYGGATATVSLSLSNATGQSLVLAYETDVFECRTSISTVTAIGRSVVG